MLNLAVYGLIKTGQDQLEGAEVCGSSAVLKGIAHQADSERNAHRFVAASPRQECTGHKNQDIMW